MSGLADDICKMLGKTFQPIVAWPDLTREKFAQRIFLDPFVTLVSRVVAGGDRRNLQGEGQTRREIMKRLVLTAAVLMFAAGTAAAKPAWYSHHGWGVQQHHFGTLKPYERVKIRRSRARLAALKRQIYADGRVTFRERIRLRIASARHRTLVRRERHD